MVALGGLAAYGGSRLPPVPGQQVGPNVFPMVVGIGLVICGGMIAMGVGRRFEEQAQAELAAHSTGEEEQVTYRWWVAAMRVLLPPALLVFYALAVDRLGFLVTAAIMVVASARALGAGWLLTVSVAICGPLFVSLAFGKLLRVPLPPGLLAPPW
jgi:putative tricarboxylic transport membrane protein